jgi:hypothetical protein
MSTSTSERSLGMPDLDGLRSIGERINTPDLEVLRATARKRGRRARIATTVSALVATVSVGTLVVGGLADDRSAPGPDVPPATQTPTPPTPTDPTPTHQSETSMTPREVVEADDAELNRMGVSAEDPDFRVSVWTATCTWCPKRFPDSQTRPTFSAMAITTDGFETARYRRPPVDPARPVRVLSPAPGVLLFSDYANGGEWLVRDDGSVTRVARVLENRPAADRRLWFECLSGDEQATWCALDVGSATAYEWGDPWAGSPGITASAVPPGSGMEPWARELLDRSGFVDLVAHWNQDGTPRSRVLTSAPAGATLVGDMVLGASEDLLYWSHVHGTERLTFHVGDDGGANWRVIEQTLPTSDISTEEILATPTGTLILRHVTERRQTVRARIWRLDSLEEGTWELVHDTGELPYMYDLGVMHQITVAGSALMLGALSSDDDGRTWTQVTSLR